MEKSYRNLLKANNMSLTAVRLAVLEAVDTHPHADADQVFSIVQSKILTTSKQAIYNNLNALVMHGIIREFKPKGRSSLYEMCTGDNHHHLVCRHCCNVVDTDCQSSAPCLTAISDHSFAIDEAEIIFWGTCPDCQSNQLTN